jgi:hypothetical protein
VRVLGDMHFLDALLLYDKDAMSETMTTQARRQWQGECFVPLHKTFHATGMRAASVAAEP